MSAVNEVFGTVELLELILLHLDFFDLSRCFRVCKQFKAVMDDSKPLLRTLWLVPNLYVAGMSPADVLKNASLGKEHQKVRDLVDSSLHPVLHGLVIYRPPDNALSCDDSYDMWGEREGWLVSRYIDVMKTINRYLKGNIPTAWKKMPLVKDGLWVNDSCHLGMVCMFEVDGCDKYHTGFKSGERPFDFKSGSLYEIVVCFRKTYLNHKKEIDDDGEEECMQAWYRLFYNDGENQATSAVPS